MDNYSKILSFSSFIIIGFLLISCDSVKTETSNKSFKGKKITSQYSNAYYSINKEANEAKELKNQINQRVKSIKNKKNSSFFDRAVQKPNLDEAMLVVNNNIDEEYILLPINTSSTTKTITSTVVFNSETNSFSKEPLFILETKNLPESEGSNDAIATKIIDQSGNIIYNSEIDHRNKNDQTKGWWDCVAYMTDKLEEERPESLNEVCEAGVGNCDAIEFGEAAVRCTVGEY